jgi:hypothetical protein
MGPQLKLFLRLRILEALDLLLSIEVVNELLGLTAVEVELASLLTVSGLELSKEWVFLSANVADLLLFEFFWIPSIDMPYCL